MLALAAWQRVLSGQCPAAERIRATREEWFGMGDPIVLEVGVGIAGRVPVIRTPALVAGSLACIGCGLGPLAKPSTVTYDSVISFAFDNGDSASAQNASLSLFGEMTLVIDDGNGDVHGTYSYDDHPSGSGTIAGTVTTDGTISIRQFGDPNKAVGATLQFLHNNWPNCDFSQAEPMQFNASVYGGDISLAGTLTVPCTYTVHRKRVTVLTTMVEALNASPRTGSSVGS